MQNIIIDKLTKLQQHKQDKLQMYLGQLIAKETSLNQAILDKDIEVDNVRQRSIAFKADSYANNLKNKVIKRLDIKQVEFRLQKFVEEIERILEEQQKLVAELKELKQKILATKAELRVFIVKIEKYQFIKQC